MIWVTTPPTDHSSVKFHQYPKHFRSFFYWGLTASCNYLFAVYISLIGQKWSGAMAFYAPIKIDGGNQSVQREIQLPSARQLTNFLMLWSAQAKFEPRWWKVWWYVKSTLDHLTTGALYCTSYKQLQVYTHVYWQTNWGLILFFPNKNVYDFIHNFIIFCFKKNTTLQS